MNKTLKNTIFSLDSFKQLKNGLSNRRHLHLSAASGSLRSFISSFIFEQLKNPLLIISSDLDSAQKMKEDLEIILESGKVGFLPAIESDTIIHHASNPALMSLRMEAIQTFLEDDHWIVVATIEGLLESLPIPEDFVDNQLYLKTGMSVDYDLLLTHLQRIGLSRESLVESVGEFSVRGGIIDMYSWNYEDPIRIELFGNEIESIRRFDVISQRSQEILDEVTILPKIGDNNRGKTFINNFISDSTVLFCEDTDVLLSKIDDYWTNGSNDYTNKKNEMPPEERFLAKSEVEKLLQKHLLIETNLIAREDVLNITFNSLPHPDFNGSIKLFFKYLNKTISENSKIKFYLQSINQSQSERIREIIDEEDILLRATYMDKSLHSGFILPQDGLHILTDHEIFNKLKRHRTYKKFKTGDYLRRLSTLSLHDYVVHNDYGVGQYLGLDTIEFGNTKKECIKIGYREGDCLFVAVDRLNLIQKYSSDEGLKPKITKLGTTEWEKTKKKTKESIKKVAKELIEIYAKRKAKPGFKFSEDSHWQKEVEALFPYEETPDQLRAIKEVKKSMEHPEPMDRLLCGDVGFGKTEVALRAAFKAIMDGKQSAILAPTTILAFQHYGNFKERLKEFPVNIEMLNRFRTPKQQKQIIEGLAIGNIDLVIGTHRLLSDDVIFKDLGLLIIDEEQRFGVRHKEKLKKYRATVDILSMTATPIPRTLHMALMGARDLSNIDTPPRNRLPVNTDIIHWNDDVIYRIINRELERKGQIYFVHNRVETIESMRDRLVELVPHARIAIGHGQMNEKRLETVMLDFIHHKYDILVSSMIIENGLDISNVNTIIINRADKFGLSQLYQLRGRVGRSTEQAYAYLLVPPMDRLTETARKRLRTIQDFTDLGSGFKVALRDLEIRGAGNLLGKEQSGFVQTVGFDMYCKILNEAVEELSKGSSVEITDGIIEKKSKYIEPKLDVNFDLLIPNNYISNEAERIAIYHRTVNLNNTDQIDDLEKELEDRFGKLPEKALLFLEAMNVKILAGHLYARRVILNNRVLKLIFSEEAQNDDSFFQDVIPRLMNQTFTSVRFLNQKDLGVEITLKGDDYLSKLAFSKKILHYIMNNK